MHNSIQKDRNPYFTPRNLYSNSCDHPTTQTDLIDFASIAKTRCEKKKELRNAVPDSHIAVVQPFAHTERNKNSAPPVPNVRRI